MSILCINTELIKLFGFRKAYLLQTFYNLSVVKNKIIYLETSASHIYNIDRLIPRRTIARLFDEFISDKILCKTSRRSKAKNIYTISIDGLIKVIHMWPKWPLLRDNLAKMATSKTQSGQNGHNGQTKWSKWPDHPKDVAKMATSQVIMQLFVDNDKKQTNQEVKEIKQEKIDENRVLEQAQTKQEIKKENVEKSQDTITSKKNGSVKSFDAFWSQYPSKVDKKQTKFYWEKNKEQLNPLLETILKDIHSRLEYHARWRDKQYIKSPLRYLRNEMWNDEIIRDGMSPKLPTKPQPIHPIDLFKHNDRTRSDILNTIKANENLLKLSKNGQCDNLTVQLNSAKNNLKGWNQAWNAHQEKHSQQKALSLPKQ